MEVVWWPRDGLYKSQFSFPELGDLENTWGCIYHQPIHCLSPSWSCFFPLICPSFIVTYIATLLLIYYFLYCTFSSHDFCLYFLASSNLTSIFLFSDFSSSSSFPVLCFSNPFHSFTFLHILSFLPILLLFFYFIMEIFTYTVLKEFLQ